MNNNMEDLKEISRKYAEEKTSELLKEAIAQAYADGFADGYKARENEESVEIETGNVKFLDMGLPSGTLWASYFLRDEDGKIVYLPYAEAKELGLPTKEQFEEMREHCKIGYEEIYDYNRNAHYLKYLSITGPSGEYIRLYPAGYEEANCKKGEGDIYSWILTDDDSIKKLVSYTSCRRTNDIVLSIGYCHAGLKLPVLLVKKK